MYAEGVADGRFAFSGRLPPGATRAVAVLPSGEEAEAACRDGEFRVVCEVANPHPPPVRFEDDSGAIVRPELPAAWPREPVDDATEPCPACGALGWDVVTPSDHSRGSVQHGDGSLEPASAVGCRRCGHEQALGAWMTFAGDEPPLDAAGLERLEALRREHWQPLSAVSFPVYALADPAAPVELGGHGSDWKGTTSVAIDQGDIAIESEAERHAYDGPVEHLRRLLSRALTDQQGFSPEASFAAMTLWFDARERERAAVVLRAEQFEVDVEIDGGPVRFAGLRAGGTWALAGHVGDVRVSISGRGVEPEDVRLRRLDPPPGGTAAG